MALGSSFFGFTVTLYDGHCIFIHAMINRNELNNTTLQSPQDSTHCSLKKRQKGREQMLGPCDLNGMLVTDWLNYVRFISFML